MVPLILLWNRTLTGCLKLGHFLRTGFRHQIIIRSLLLAIEWTTSVGINNAQAPSFKFENLNTQDRLPSNNVYALCEDLDGIIWVGTSNGICKFDGYGLTQINGCVNQLSFSPDIRFLFCDSQGRVWAGTNSLGLFVKEREKECFEKPRDAAGNYFFEDAVVLSIAQDKEGKIWCATYGDGMIIYDPASRSVQQFAQNSSTLPFDYSNITGIYYDPADQSIWALSSECGLIHFKDTQQFLFDRIEIPGAKKFQTYDWGNILFKDYKNRLWLLIDHSILRRYNLTNKSWDEFNFSNKDEFPYCNTVFEMSYDPVDSIIYFSAEKLGFSIFDLRTDKTALYSNGKYYSNAGPIVDVQDILFTKNHDLYIGGYNLGLNAQFEKMGRKRTLPIGQKPLDKILNIAPINKDEILLGTDDKGLLKFNVVTGEVNNIVIKDLPNKDIDVVKSIYRDKTGQFWLGHWHKGMTSFNLNGNRLQNYRNNGPAPFYLPESNNHVWGFTEDQDSNFWILMLRSSAVCYNKDRSQKIVFNKQYGLPDLGDSQLLDIHTDADGNVWLASENKGLYVRWRGKESFQRIQHQDGDVHSLATNSCLMVFSDSKNNIWVGTKDKGLDLLDKVNNRFIHFSTAEGLLENMVVSMVENTNGDIWIATPSGISRIRLFDGRYKVDFKYPISKTYNFAHLASYLDAETATLYLGGSEGLYALDLKEFDVPRESPRVLISGLNFQKDSSVPPASDSLLHHLNKFGWLTFQKRNAFVSLNLASTILNESKSNEFAYKLDGFESTWHFLKDGERQVTYIGLPEGHYKLHLKTKTPYSDWGETRIVGIRVVAPFWDTQWFFRLILIACSTLIAGVFVLYWLRRQELLTRMRLEIENQKLEKNREQLSYEVLDQSSELIVRTVEIMHQKTVMEEVQQKLGTLQNAGANKDTEVMAQLSKMLQSESSNDDWEAFRIYVDQRNAQFSQKLTTQYPSLTPTDVRHCILIRLNMSTHDIAKLLKISVQGVQKSRFRLKKKLGLNQSIDLYAFIASI